MNNSQAQSSSTLETTTQQQNSLNLESQLTLMEELPVNAYIEELIKLGTQLTTDQREYFSDLNKLDYYFEKKKQFLLDNPNHKEEHPPESVDPIFDDIDSLLKRGVTITEKQQEYLFRYCLNQQHYFDQQLYFLLLNEDGNNEGMTTFD